MWGSCLSVCREHQFKDKYLFYRFCEDDQGVGTVPSHAQKKECEEELQDTLITLAQIGPDAMMRMILRKLWVYHKSEWCRLIPYFTWVLNSGNLLFCKSQDILNFCYSFIQITTVKLQIHKGCLWQFYADVNSLCLIRFLQ